MDRAEPENPLKTPLARVLAEQIDEHGPITVAQYMETVLSHPEYGYYMTRDPLGRAGDFTTAPEISQMFGEMIGVWCAGIYHAMGNPGRIQLVELGPGRGTLMADALRVIGGVPEMAAAVRVAMVETSPALTNRQRMALVRTSIGEPSWHLRFADVPEGPAIILANEFFDALPIHQLIRTADGWRERLVGTDAATDGFGFVRADGPSELEDLIPEPLRGAATDSIVEISPAARSLAGEIADRVSGQGGAALIIDYGPATSGSGDSLQAVRSHKYHDILESPGSADLTAHVDFSALAAAAAESGARVAGPVDQGDFLKAMGIEVRAARLDEVATTAQKEDVATALLRLTGADQMGSLFKALALSHAELPTPEGFPDGA